MGLHIDSTFTVQTKRRHMSTMLGNTEALRTMCVVLTNLLLPAQAQQFGKKMYAGFTENTLMTFLKELLDEDNFGLQRDIQGEVWVTLVWVYCCEYKLQLRNEALRLCFEDG